MTISPLAVRLGSRTPRVSKFPVARSSAGQEAIELAESAGLHLDPWQQDVLSASLYERRDGHWASFEVGLIVPRQNGKGAILEARELAGLFLFNERMIVHTSHEFKTSLEAFRRIRTLIESTPDLERKVVRFWQTTGYEGIELTNGCRLRFVARSKGSGRGFSGDLVILDEAFALTSEQVEALMPTMSARPNPQIWYTSSPPLDAVTGEPLYALRTRGAAPAEPGESLCWFEWGAEPGADLDDRTVWAATNPALGIRISEDFVARERAAMTADGFSRERLGIWPLSESWTVVSDEDWEACLDPGSQAVDPLILAIDVTPERSHSAIAVVGPRVDGHLHGEIIEHRPGTAWVVARVKELVERWKPFRIVVDPGGAAGSLIPELNFELVPTFYEELTLMRAQDVKHAYGLFHQHVATEPLAGVEVSPRRLKVRERSPFPLTAAVKGATTRRIGDGTTWNRKSDAVDISPLVALTNALHGFVARPAPEVVVPPATAPIAPSPPFFGSSSRLNLGGTRGR